MFLVQGNNFQTKVKVNKFEETAVSVLRTYESDKPTLKICCPLSTCKHAE